MVALKKYARIEASGLWRAHAEAQRRDVIVVLGDATLTITDLKDQPLAHWSIAAIARANPEETPARYHPDGDPGEELELAANEVEMVAAIETLRRAIARARPHPGRLRLWGFALSTAALVLLAVFWLPGALRDHTLGVVPDVARQDIGNALLLRLQRVTGPVCGTSASHSALNRLGTRLGAEKLAITRGGPHLSLHLPGGHILVSRKVLEDFEEPDVAAGFVLSEQVLSGTRDPLRAVLEHAGTLATFRLLTSGQLAPDTLDAYAEHLLTEAKPQPDTDQILQTFARAGVRSTPYAYARDVTGESVLALIEGDPMRGQPLSPLLSDADWLRLQDICGTG